MKNLKRDVRGELFWSDIIIIFVVVVFVILAATASCMAVKHWTAPLEIRITNTSDEPLPVEIYIDGVFYIADIIDPKQVKTYEYKNGFWGPGETIVTVKLPNTLFEKIGWGSQTVSFVFE